MTVQDEEHVLTFNTCVFTRLIVLSQDHVNGEEFGRFSCDAS